MEESNVPNPTDLPPQTPPGADTKYLLVVCGLLMCIVILLSVLWIRERRNSSMLAQQLQQARKQNIAGSLQGQLARLVAGQSAAGARPLQREDLPAETVTWNGQPRTILHISAAAGNRIGLEPGDVVAVSQPPATAPTTQPAGK